MMAERTVLAEALDALAADDPTAVHSRRDLRRLHRAMGTRGILRAALQDCLAQGRSRPALRILEIGAGDGTLLLGVAKRLAFRWPTASVSLLDRQPLLTAATTAAYAALGWTVVMETADVFQWLAREDQVAAGEDTARWDLVIANLFLHHFRADALALLMRALARRCDSFVAVEPRRSGFALMASHMVAALGANAVTREDAVLSVRAGFRGSELSGHWRGSAGDWELKEYPAGLFSHVFRADRVAGGSG